MFQKIRTFNTPDFNPNSRSNPLLGKRSPIQQVNIKKLRKYTAILVVGMCLCPGFRSQFLGL